MKANIHPMYYPQATVTCACGNAFTVGSTKPSIRVEICAACHPFFTGQQKFIDTLGRVELFQKKQQAAHARKAGANPKRGQGHEQKRPMTLREMLLEQNKG